MALFTAIKKFPDKHYNDNEPIEMELVPDEILYKDMPNFELQKNKQKFLKERSELLKKKAIIENLLQKKISDISISDNIDDIRTNVSFKKLYYQWDEIINKKVQIQNKEIPFSLSIEQAEQVYDKIKILDSNLEYVNLIIELLENLSIPRQLRTPGYTLPKSTSSITHKETLHSIYINKCKNDPNTLLSIVQKYAPNVYQSIRQSCDSNNPTTKEIEKFIQENKEEVINYILGATLDITEDRAFSALRCTGTQQYDDKLISKLDDTIVTNQSKIYDLCGLKKGLDGKYDYKQRMAIKRALTNPNSNLLKPIHIEIPQNHEDGNGVRNTRFILDIIWQGDTIECKIPRIFLADVDEHFWLDDIEGRNRLMATLPNGYQNKSGYSLHKYLCHKLRNTNEFNIMSLLKASELIYLIKHRKPKEALEKLQFLLDKMYEVKTLIKKKPVLVSSKSDQYGKYCLERI